MMVAELISVVQSFLVLLAFCGTWSSYSPCGVSSFSLIRKCCNFREQKYRLMSRRDDALSAEFKAKSNNPGFGGYWPGDPNAKKYNVTVQIPPSAASSTPGSTISLLVPEDRYIYFYFEEMGFPLPFVNAQRMCRQGCCTICTAKVLNTQPEKEHGEFSNQAIVKMDSPLGFKSNNIFLFSLR